MPADSIKGWPLIGEQVYQLWALAATDMRAILIEAVPWLKPFGGRLLNFAGTAVLGLAQFVAAIIIAGFLYAPGTAARQDAAGPVPPHVRRTQRRDAQARRQHHSQRVARRRRHRGGAILPRRVGSARRRHSRGRLLDLRRAGARNHPDRTDDPVRPDRAVELDAARHRERDDFHRLHGRRQPRRQRSAAPGLRARTDDADADHLRRRHRRHHRLWHQRPFSRAHRARRRLGAAGGMDRGGAGAETPSPSVRSSTNLASATSHKPWRKRRPSVSRARCRRGGRSRGKARPPVRN